MIVLTGFVNFDKINKIKQFWSSDNPDCLV